MKELWDNLKLLTWIIDEPRLLQVRGTKHAAVVLHRKCFVTMQMQ